MIDLVTIQKIAKRAAWRAYRNEPSAIKRLNDIEDFSQEALLALWQMTKRYRPQEGSFERFAYKRARGAICDLIRESDCLSRTWRKRVARGEIERPTEIQLDSMPSNYQPCYTDPQFRRLEARRDIEKLISVLRDPKLNFLIRQCLAEIPQSETCKALGVHPSRVSQLVTKAIKEMRSSTR